MKQFKVIYSNIKTFFKYLLHAVIPTASLCLATFFTKPSISEASNRRIEDYKLDDGDYSWLNQSSQNELQNNSNIIIADQADLGNSVVIGQNNPDNDELLSQISHVNEAHSLSHIQEIPLLVENAQNLVSEQNNLVQQNANLVENERNEAAALVDAVQDNLANMADLVSEVSSLPVEGPYLFTRFSLAVFLGVIAAVIGGYYLYRGGRNSTGQTYTDPARTGPNNPGTSNNFNLPGAASGSDWNRWFMRGSFIFFGFTLLGLGFRGLRYLFKWTRRK